MVKIAIASGKGGTGKSTISTNLAYILSLTCKDVAIIDCDVEEPNCHIFLNPEITSTEKHFLDVPLIDNDLCIGCGKCAEICEFNSLAIVKKKAIIFSELCHGCGGCELVCPQNAISKGKRELGEVEVGTAEKLTFIHGKSRIGEAMSPPLIKAAKKKAENFDIQIIDCPPGTSCPVINAVSNSDFVIMVTEPTPFGLYDLKLAVNVVKKLNKKCGIVINRAGENDFLTENYAKEENIPILTKIPEDRRIAEVYSKGKLIIKELPEYQEAFTPLVEAVKGVIK